MTAVAPVTSTTALAAALETDDPASIPDPMAAAFRTFADSTGADRLGDDGGS